MTQGRSIALFGDSGSGKTTQVGELAKRVFKRTGKRTLYHAMDKGGYGSISPLVNLGVVRVDQLSETDDPWVYVNDAASGVDLAEDVGLVVFDSGTSAAEALLSSCAKMSAGGEEIGGRPAPKFIIGRKRGQDALRIGSNVDSHYLVVQGFLLDAIWKSSWLTSKGIDVVWTFGVHRGEKEDSTTILGPKLAGKALTPHMPKWFNHIFMLVSVPGEVGAAPVHSLYVQEQPLGSGTGMSFGNARYPLDATTPLPAVITPADINVALDAIEMGEAEAEAAIRLQLGL